MLKPGGRFVWWIPSGHRNAGPAGCCGKLTAVPTAHAESLATAISSYFRIARTERFAVYHEYALFIASK